MPRIPQSSWIPSQEEVRSNLNARRLSIMLAVGVELKDEFTILWNSLEILGEIVSRGDPGWEELRYAKQALDRAMELVDEQVRWAREHGALGRVHASAQSLMRT